MCTPVHRAMYINGPLLGILTNSSSKLIILYVEWRDTLHANRSLHKVVERKF